MQNNLQKHKTQKINIFFFIAIFIAISLSIYVFYYFFEPEKEIYYITIAGPVNDSTNQTGKSIITGAEIAINELNAGNLPGNIELRLNITDDKSKPGATFIPAEKAKEIISDKKNIAVIGNYYESAAKSTIPIYSKSKIPLIIPTICESENLKPENVYFINQSFEYQARFLAKYIFHVIKKSKIAIIYSDAEESNSSKKAFSEEYLNLSKIKPVELIIPEINFNPEILSDYSAQLQEAEVVFIPSKSENILKILKYFKSKNINAFVFADTRAGDENFARQAGVYGEGLFAINSYLQEISNEKATSFDDICKKKYSRDADNISIHTYEAVMLIGQAVKAVGVGREDLCNYFNKLKKSKKIQEQLTGKFSFDNSGFTRKIPYIGKCSQGKFVSADFQLVENFNPKIPDNNIIFDEKNLIKSTVVSVGVFLKDVNNFNIFDSKYSADLLIWFKWKPDEIQNFDFEIENGTIKNSDTIEISGNSEVTGFKSFEIKGIFTNEFFFYDYPFDKQKLVFSFVPKEFTTEKMIWVNALKRDSYKKEELNLGEWKVNNHSDYISTLKKTVSIGNSEFDNRKFEIDKSCFTYDIGISRSVCEYLAKLVPLIIVIIVAFLSFFLKIRTFAGSRMALGVTAFLSAVAFQMSQSGVLNNVGYITKSDYFYIITYFIIFSVVLETVIVNRISENGKPDKADIIDKISAIFFPVISFIAIVYIYY